jgi:SpoVK/Ycf46/Vps4 family AAA+-type ATPase
VKTYVQRLVARIQVDERLGERVQPGSLHMIFKGNPGTGKTTVARLFGEVLQNLGYLRRGDLTEVTSADLIAEHVGQTSLKTREVIEKALDGVLFIDEAYTLAHSGGNTFAQEAVDELVKQMDEYRHRLVIVLAGYSEEMDIFLDTNPGLSSRIRTTLDFPDYTSAELQQILQMLATERGYTLSVGAEARVDAYLEAIRTQIPHRFGNGRTVRNLFDNMEDRIKQRVAPLIATTPDDATFRALATHFLPEDVPEPPEATVPTASSHRSIAIRIPGIAFERTVSELDIRPVPPAADRSR